MDKQSEVINSDFREHVSSRRPYAGRTGDFFKGVQFELEKVEWPKRNVILRFTLLVLAVVTFFVIYVGGIDMMLAKIFYWLKTFR